MKPDITVSMQDNTELLKNAEQEQIEQALIAIGMTAESNAKGYCPVDTGRLRNSITNEAYQDEQAVVIGTNVEYAAYVELGTSKMAARPYLRPALENHTNEYQALLEQFLGKESS